MNTPVTDNASVDPKNADLFSGRRFAAVLFDSDGTLVDSTPAVERSWRTWSDRMGLAGPDLDAFHGRPAAATVGALVAEPDRDAALTLIAQLELDDVDGVVPLPGAVESLAALQGRRVAIATSCTLALAQARLGAAGIEIPSVLVTVDDVQRGKPAPDPYLLAAQRLGVDPTECLVVEDAVSGIAAARAAGCAVLAVRTTATDDQLDADAIVDDLSAVEWVFDQEGIGVRARG